MWMTTTLTIWWSLVDWNDNVADVLRCVRFLLAKCRLYVCIRWSILRKIEYSFSLFNCHIHRFSISWSMISKAIFLTYDWVLNILTLILMPWCHSARLRLWRILCVVDIITITILRDEYFSCTTQNDNQIKCIVFGPYKSGMGADSTPMMILLGAYACSKVAWHARAPSNIIIGICARACHKL